MGSSVGFDNIGDHIVPLNEFRRNWGFSDQKTDVWSEVHLQQLKPLDPEAAQFVWQFIGDCELHNDIPFTKGFFRTIDKALFVGSNSKEIKKWLYQRRIPFKKEVFLSWQPDEAIVAPWKLFIKYFESFYFPGSDLTVIDQSLNWALLLRHEELYFGTKKKFEPSVAFDDIDFLW